eukprot:TRINITY_DN1340_c0_g1_i8.p3 TRINITY_DN1340_c0_g1~~TRINITY_DN1340_c0_g1_i8.p3  ORF type:complete len:253 (+),score=56.59 TRINITY_DN1340_c0_g1_i8:741-1499(+)
MVQQRMYSGIIGSRGPPQPLKCGKDMQKDTRVVARTKFIYRYERHPNSSSQLQLGFHGATSRSRTKGETNLKEAKEQLLVAQESGVMNQDVVQGCVQVKEEQHQEQREDLLRSASQKLDRCGSSASQLNECGDLQQSSPEDVKIEEGWEMLTEYEGGEQRGEEEEEQQQGDPDRISGIDVNRNSNLCDEEDSGNNREEEDGEQIEIDGKEGFDEQEDKDGERDIDHGDVTSKSQINQGRDGIEKNNQTCGKK